MLQKAEGHCCLMKCSVSHQEHSWRGSVLWHELCLWRATEPWLQVAGSRSEVSPRSLDSSAALLRSHRSQSTDRCSNPQFLFSFWPAKHCEVKPGSVMESALSPILKWNEEAPHKRSLYWSCFILSFSKIDPWSKTAVDRWTRARAGTGDQNAAV